MPVTRLLTLALLWLGLPALAAGPAAVLLGAGATFPAPVYAAWAQAYGQQTGVGIHYAAVGSGEGLRRIERGEVDFGASDVPLAVADLERRAWIQFPAVIGAVVPVFNIHGLRDGELHLSGRVLGDIYLGLIRRWDDPALVALNPGLKLPSQFITVVHRAESSGTSFLFTRYLARHNPQWQAGIGASAMPEWPIGVAGSGNAGVASYVERTRGAIGYVEYAYAKAHHLAVAALPGSDGAYVVPGFETFRAAVDAARWVDAGDLSQSFDGRTGAAGWPITGSSFILISRRPDARARQHEVMRFFGWALRHGQSIAESLDYVAVPPAAVGLIEAQWRALDGLAREDPVPPAGVPR